jgi:glycosyltransferase involved in cell wall biosynthesis
MSGLAWNLLAKGAARMVHQGSTAMSDENYLFSVIIPTYARPAALDRCLSALSRVQFPRDRFEVIVVDDGSPIDLAPVIAPYRAMMKVRLIRQSNAGPSAARNHGAERARGRFLAFTDDDCAVSPQWLSALAEALLKREDQLVGGRTVNALGRNLCASASQLILDVVHDHFGRDGDSYRFFASNNMAMSAERYRLMEGFDVTFRTSEDRDFCDRWRAAGWTLAYAPEARMDHAHQMGVRDFFRQHYAYGRGAWRFHRVRSRRGSGRFEIQGSFYWHCFRQAAGEGGHAAGLMAMLSIWQLANALGFFRQAVAQGVVRGQSDGINPESRWNGRFSHEGRGSIQFLHSAAAAERQYRAG